MARSVVIGGSGFMGRAVVRELIKRGESVTAIDRSSGTPVEVVDGSGKLNNVICDANDLVGLQRCFEGASEIYHLAGKLGTSELESDIRGSIQSNVIGALNVFEAAVTQHVPRVFFASKPTVWLNTYTITKHCAEQIARLITQHNPVQICTLRYQNVYGPEQKLVPVRKMLPVFAAQALRRLPIQVYGDGQQTVDLLFSRDAARLSVDFLRTGYCEKPLDCGTGRSATVLSVAEAVNAWFGSKAGVQHLPMRRGETPGTRIVADLQGLSSVLGPLSFTPWQKGLAESLDWYANRPEHEIDTALAFYGIHQKFSTSWN